ncbi:MAG: GspH/FimT family pseudopilin [candidate division NC10 bacterium]|nr:GspH/FimT family pseudopilin [candidate division NC10 bacterium]
MDRGRGFAESKRTCFAHAFTLAEVLIAVGLVAVISAFSLPTLTGTINGYRLRSAAWQLAGDLRLARQKAVSTNRRHRICFDNCGGTVSAGGYLIQRDTGSGWDIEATVWPRRDKVQVTSNATITFAETGEAAGGTVTLARGASSFQVRTHFTGKVTVCKGSCP